MKIKKIIAVVKALAKASIRADVINDLQPWRFIRHIHFQSAGLSTFLIARLVYKRKRNSPNPNTIEYSSISVEKSKNNGLESENIEKWLCSVRDQIKSNGFHYIGHVRQHYLEELVDEVSQFSRFPMETNNKLKSKIFKNLDHSKLAHSQYNLNTARLEYDQDCLMSSELVHSLMVDPLFKAIADKYLKCNSYLDLFCGWDSVYANGNDEAMSTAAQIPHIDLKHLDFIKFFIFLSDVTSDDGAFEIYPNSALNLFRPKFNDGRQKRSTLDQIFQRKAALLCKKGAVYAVDTKNFHCDGIVRKGGWRSCLQLEFTSNILGAELNYSNFKASSSPFSLSIDYQFAVFK